MSERQRRGLGRAVTNRIVVVDLDSRAAERQVSVGDDQRVAGDADAGEQRLARVAAQRLANHRRLDRQLALEDPPDRGWMIWFAVAIDRMGDDDDRARFEAGMRE